MSLRVNVACSGTVVEVVDTEAGEHGRVVAVIDVKAQVWSERCRITDRIRLAIEVGDDALRAEEARDVDRRAGLQRRGLL